MIQLISWKSKCQTDPYLKKRSGNGGAVAERELSLVVVAAVAVGAGVGRGGGRWSRRVSSQMVTDPNFALRLVWEQWPMHRSAISLTTNFH